MKGLISAKLVTAPIFWVIKGTKEEMKLLPYVSVEIIELTLERLSAKKEKKSGLVNYIKEVRKETNEKMEEMLDSDLQSADFILV